MTRMLLGILAVGTLTLVGCTQASTTAPSTNPNKPGDTRELTLSAPKEQGVTRNSTEKLTLRVDRDNFDGAVKIDIQDLPAGVSVVNPEMTIPAGKDSIEVTIKAAPDAKVVEDHKVKVVAKPEGQSDMKEAVVFINLDVNAE